MQGRCTRGDYASCSEARILPMAAAVISVVLVLAAILFPATVQAEESAGLVVPGISGEEASEEVANPGSVEDDELPVLGRVGSESEDLAISDDILDVQASSSYTDEEYSLKGLIVWMLGNDDLDLSDEAIADLELAMDQIEACESLEYMDCSDDDDAANLDNVKKSLSIMSKISQLRIADDNFEGFGEVYTNFFLMVSSAYTANVSSTAYDHVSDFSGFAYNEGLMWGSSDPASAWYTDEKEIFDSYKDELGYSGYLTNAQLVAIVLAAGDEAESFSNYFSLLFAQDQAMGVGYCTYANRYGNITASFNCATVSAYEDIDLELYTVSQMQGYISDYIDYLESGECDEVSEINGTSFVSLAGGNRYATMEAIVSEAYEGETSEYAVLATGANFPDALAAAPLAGVLDAPIVLVDSSDPSLAIDVLDELDVSKVYVVGGIKSVSGTTMNKIASATGVSCSRLQGGTRQVTAMKVANEVIKIMASDGASPDTAILATGKTYADVLSASPYAYYGTCPIYLTNNDGSISSDVLDAIDEGGYEKVLVIGGTGSVSKATYDKISSLSGVSVERIYGSDRYETSAEMAAWCVKNAGMTYNGCAIATGTSFPDALAGAALCGRSGSVLLLSNGSTIAGIDAIEDNATSIDTVYYLGGTSSVSRLTRNLVQSVFR